MATWEDLPGDLLELIWAMRRRASLDAPASAKIQAAWRGYRMRVLLGRFRMLRYLHTFRQWNPSASEFVRRARL